MYSVGGAVGVTVSRSGLILRIGLTPDRLRWTRVLARRRQVRADPHQQVHPIVSQQRD